MATFIGFWCGLIIIWLLMINWETRQDLRRQSEELAEAHRRIGKMRRQLELSASLRKSEPRQLTPFGEDYVQPYSLFRRN